MKTIYIIIAAMILVNNTTAQEGQWSDTFLYGNLITSVYFTNSNTGHAVGGQNNDGASWGIILKTTDGGMNWEKLTTNFYLHSIYFINENTGYAIGEYILKTINGGNDWIIQYPGDNDYTLDEVNFPDALRGYFIGENGRVLRKTNDQGHPYGLDEKSANSVNLKIFPNPASSSLTIESSEKSPDYIITLLDVNYKQILQQILTGATTTIDIGALPGGVYFIRITGDRTLQVEKIVKQ